MRLISKYTDYAMRALMFMAKDEEQVFTASDLSRKLKISKPFLRMILQKLSKKNILTSYKGREGGFRLALPAEKIFVADLIKIFQEPVKFDNCFIRKNLCPNIKTCPMRKKLKDMGSYLKREFESISIKTLLDEKV